MSDHPLTLKLNLTSVHMRLYDYQLMDGRLFRDARIHDELMILITCIKIVD